MRRKFGKMINELAKKDDRIYLLVGDIGYRVFDDFTSLTTFLIPRSELPSLPEHVLRSLSFHYDIIRDDN